jgi:hypothetical protein
MRKGMLVLTAAALLLLAGCSEKTGSPEPQATLPKTNDGDAQKPIEPAQPPLKAEEKTEDQIKQEIREKLGRLTTPQSGYAQPVGDDNAVQGVSSLEEVTELLRKKGYSLPLAKTLTHEFYKEQTQGGQTKVVLIARDGYAGVFDPKEEATFTKKNKWIWVVEQEHPDDALHGPHTATYEVEVLKDGTYRLNSWTTKAM